MSRSLEDDNPMRAGGPSTREEIILNQDIKRRWIAALRSGRYKQGRRKLNCNEEQFCCLGVLAEIAVEDGYLVKTPPVSGGAVEYALASDASEPMVCLINDELASWAGLAETNPCVAHPKLGRRTLTSWNDSELLNFNEIADLIEEKL
jgi:hypothetical protein